MKGRLSLIAFVGATGSVHLLPVLPGVVTRYVVCAGGLCVCAAVGWWARRSGNSLWWSLPLFALTLGFFLTVVRADVRLSDRLDSSNQNLVSRVQLRVVSLPSAGNGSISFDADVLASIPAGVPRRIRVSWPELKWGGPYAAVTKHESSLPTVIPGQRWRMALVLKSPYGARNPSGFDYEGHIFATGVRAMGTVRGVPQLLGDEPWYSLSVIAQRARHHVRQAMQEPLSGKRYAAVLLALAIGDQASVDAHDWDVFSRTGITHLVSISGTHVTIIAGFAGWLMFAFWRRCRVQGRWLAERVPAQTAAALTALLVAWLYCLLAGWGVPAQRTFLMLAVIAGTYVFRLPIRSFTTLLLAAAVVVLLDPWAMMSSGFWLSFAAVGVLMAMAVSVAKSDQPRRRAVCYRLGKALWVATRLQLAITVALLPVLAMLFQEISVVSPLVNAYAIPMVSLLITPLALVGALLAVVPGMTALTSGVVDTGHMLLQVMMWPTERMAEWGAANITVASAPLPLYVLAFTGVLAGLMPRGLPGRRAAWLLVLPALCWTPSRPEHGGWRAYVLDVGQAGSIVIRTAGHTLLFDTGIRHSVSSDSATRAIIPFLRSIAVHRLDALILSHADIDHVGGLRSVLEAMTVKQSYASFDVRKWLHREAGLLRTPDVLPTLPRAMSRCHAGQRWELDGVQFEMLWPSEHSHSGLKGDSRERNDNSCVLGIKGRHHSIILTGDINASQELELVERGLSRHDVVLAAHHGSKNSSSAEFIAATQPQHVIMQAGAWSRYGHPHAETLARWGAGQATPWRTDHHGAVIVTSGEHGLSVRAQRWVQRRYWQNG